MSAAARGLQLLETAPAAHVGAGVQEEFVRRVGEDPGADVPAFQHAAPVAGRLLLERDQAAAHAGMGGDRRGHLPHLGRADERLDRLAFEEHLEAAVVPALQADLRARGERLDGGAGPRGRGRCASTLSAIERYMAPVSRNGTPSRLASRRAAVLLPTPDGPSMATIRGCGHRGVFLRPAAGLALDRGLLRRSGFFAAPSSRRLLDGAFLPPGSFSSPRAPSSPQSFLRRAAFRLLSLRALSFFRARARSSISTSRAAQLAHGAERQVGIAQRADRHPAQLLHRMADAQEHLADLARAALGELDDPPGVLASLVVVAAAGGAPRASAASVILRGRGALRPSSTMPARSRSSSASVGRPLTLTS